MRRHVDTTVAWQFPKHIQGSSRAGAVPAPRITRLHPVQGFCADNAVFGHILRYPCLHDPTITGAIVGVGAARKTAAVRWNVASDVVLAWIMTLPAAGLFGAAFYDLYKLLS
jgi:PiT family inorganic phosphate transporter